MSAARVFTPPKRPIEREFFAFDYRALLAAGEVIDEATWSIAVAQGADAAPAAMLSGSPVINGTKVSQLVIGGVNNVQYLLQCTAETSTGQILVLDATLWVKS